MAYILKNENVEIHIDDPMVNYKFSRFDWTGKIVKVQYKGISFASRERKDEVNEDQFGKGFYNEFGIDSPLGFKDIKVGEWFHKIGIGLLQKTSDHYDFMNKYLIRPAKFVVEKKNESVTIKCISSLENGYAYNLSKDICLNSDGFEIHYQLRNTGAKQINTDEYVHNFISIGNKSIGEDYLLKFPSTLCPGLNGEVVNPEGRVLIQK